MTGRCGVDLYDHYPSGVGVVGELDVGAPYDLDGLDDPVRVVLQPILKLLGYGQHGAVQKESPVWTPMASTFSMKQTVII